MVNFFCNVSVVPGAIVLCITIHSGENFLKSEIILECFFQIQEGEVVFQISENCMFNDQVSQGRNSSLNLNLPFQGN